VTFRHFLSWKPLFYEALLPALRRLGPAGADAILGGLGGVAAWAWPPRQRELTRALARAKVALLGHWNLEATRRTFAGNTLRFLARDYLLDGATDAQVFARFDVCGFEHVQATLGSGQGAILLGCHLGGYLAALHWLYRREVPLRLLVQRPRHVSGVLQARFDRGDGPHPQTGFFLRRGMPPSTAVERVFQARAALRRGLALYMTGDIPWQGPNARTGRLLGFDREFLSVWADLAVLARAPVIPLYCTHRPGGRFALTFDAPWILSPGDEAAAVARYFGRLEAEIAGHPADAVAYLLWPCYAPPDESSAARREVGASLNARAANLLRNPDRDSPSPRGPFRRQSGRRPGRGDATSPDARADRGG
jgi:phosphatidylinositol dimannoside acyltransferase